MAITYDKLLEEIQGLRTDLGTTGINFDAIKSIPTQVGTQSFFPSLKDAAKQMLRQKNPEITKDQADLIFDSEEELNAKDEEKERKRREKEEFKALSKEQQQAITEAEKIKKRQERQARSDKRRAERKKKVQQYKQIFKNKINDWLKEAEEALKAIKDSLLAIFTGFLDIVKRLITAIVTTVSGIIGLIKIIAVPPFNIPNAITQAMKIIESYLNILKAIQDLNPYYRIFDIMPTYIDKNKLKIISTIFTPITQGLRAFFWPIQKFNGLVLELFRWLQEFLFRRRESVFRKATKKLKKLGHLYRTWFIHPQMKGKISIVGIEIPNPFFPGTIRGDFFPQDDEREYPCFAFEEEDLDEIQSLLATFIIGDEGNPELNRVVAYRVKISDDATEIANAAGLGLGDQLDFSTIDFDSIADQFENLPQTQLDIQVESEDDFVYDIELPDGTIIQNITEEGIEYYKQNYILKYVNAVTQAIQVAAQSQ